MEDIEEFVNGLSAEDLEVPDREVAAFLKELLEIAGGQGESCTTGKRADNDG